MANNCGVDSSSPSCTCHDYYGNILPEYKYYSATLQTYSCCFGDIARHVDSKDLYDFAKNMSNSSACANFLERKADINNESDLKKILPILYWQSNHNKSLFNIFKRATFYPEDNTIKCNSSTGTPYIVSYPSYSSGERNYKVLCATGSIHSLQNISFENEPDAGEIDYRINYVKSDDGTDCKQAINGECKVKYGEPNMVQYNIGSVAYESDTNILEGPAIFSIWFWVAALVITLVISFVTYYLYYRGMERYFSDGVRYLDRASSGLGGTAKIHSLKNKAAVNHMGS
jgi:hypothetical protein